MQDTQQTTKMFPNSGNNWRFENDNSFDPINDLPIYCRGIEELVFHDTAFFFFQTSFPKIYLILNINQLTIQYSIYIFCLLKSIWFLQNVTGLPNHCPSSKNSERLPGLHFLKSKMKKLQKNIFSFRKFLKSLVIYVLWFCYIETQQFQLQLLHAVSICVFKFNVFTLYPYCLYFFFWVPSQQPAISHPTQNPSNFFLKY
jgi:hypothetical protein